MYISFIFVESNDDDTEATAAKGTEVEPSIPVSWHFYKNHWWNMRLWIWNLKNIIDWMKYCQLVRCHPKKENKDVMMNEMKDAHEQVSWSIIIIPWLLKKTCFWIHTFKCILVLELPKEIRALIDQHKKEFWLHAFAFCLLCFVMFNILFCELACLSMYQDIHRLLEAQTKLVNTNKGLKQVSWMKQINAVIEVKPKYLIFRHFKHWLKIYNTICFNFVDHAHTELNDSTFFGI